MEKLIELLDQYRKQNPKEFFGDYGSLVVLTGEAFVELNRLIIISKEYGFIKWLVDNDKIDRKHIPTGFDYQYQGKEDIYCVSYELNILTMRLSIQDNPIEFLVSILK